MSAERPCRGCGCELTPKNRAKASGFICRSCATEENRARNLRRKRRAGECGRSCSECAAPICAVNKSGLCSLCSRRALAEKMRRRVHTGPRQLQKLPEPHACPRCSITTNYPVCRDCRDVLRTLGELHRWVDGLVAA